MPKSAILKKMKPKGNRPPGILKELIKSLIQSHGAYIIVSSSRSTSNKALKNRIGAMKSVIASEEEPGNLHVVFFYRNRMKNILIYLQDKLNLLKRGSIEVANYILMSVCDIDHSRHRNPFNAMLHILSGLAAYTCLNHKQNR